MVRGGPTIVGYISLNIVCACHSNRALAIIYLVSKISVDIKTEIPVFIIQAAIESEIQFWLIGSGVNAIIVVNFSIAIRILVFYVPCMGIGLNYYPAFTYVAVHFCVRLKHPHHFQYVKTAHRLSIVRSGNEPLLPANSTVRDRLTTIQSGYGVGIECRIGANVIR